MSPARSRPTPTSDRTLNFKLCLCPPVLNPWEHRTSNIQRPTSNTQPPINGPIGNHWLFDVGCWVLDVFLRFMGSMHEVFGEFSPRRGTPSRVLRFPAPWREGWGLDWFRERSQAISRRG